MSTNELNSTCKKVTKLLVSEESRYKAIHIYIRLYSLVLWLDL